MRLSQRRRLTGLMRKLLTAFKPLQTAEFGTRDVRNLEAVIQTEYGRVSLSFFAADSPTDTPWLACQLKDWDAPRGVSYWRGWRHWKQNYHPASCRIDADEFVNAAERHILSFRPEFFEEGWRLPRVKS